MLLLQTRWILKISCCKYKGCLLCTMRPLWCPIFLLKNFKIQIKHEKCTFSYYQHSNEFIIKLQNNNESFIYVSSYTNTFLTFPSPVPSLIFSREDSRDVPGREGAGDVPNKIGHLKVRFLRRARVTRHSISIEISPLPLQAISCYGKVSQSCLRSWPLILGYCFGERMIR